MTSKTVSSSNRPIKYKVNVAHRPIPVDTPEWQEAAKLPKEETSDRLRVISFNVWFDSFYFEDRLDALVKILLSSGGDVVCLQEVTRRFETALRASKIVSGIYELSPFAINPYGVMILARKTLAPTFREVPFPSEMWRKLLICELGSSEGGGGTGLPPWLQGSAVATVHLESLDTASYRRRQLQVSSKELGTYSGRCVLCGDFNFDDTQERGEWRQEGALGKSAAATPARSTPLENEVLLEVFGESFADQWPLLRPGERGATFDGGTNPQCVRDPLEIMRYDRMMLSTGGLPPLGSLGRKVKHVGGAVSPDPSVLWKGSAIRMLGTEAINDIGIKPSDHYGLELDIIPASSTCSRFDCYGPRPLASSGAARASTL